VTIVPETVVVEVVAATPSRFGAVGAMPRLALVGGLLLVTLVVLGAGAPIFTHWGSTEIDFSAIDTPPGVHGHLLGTDLNGMDIWSRVLYATRIDLGIAIAAVAIAVSVGTVVGGLIGYIGGWLDEIGMRTMDIVQSFPAFVLALVVAALLGRGLVNLVAVIALVNAPSYVRLMRSEVRSTREHGYVEAARAAGETNASILFRHVIPNSLRPSLVVAPLNCGWAILTLAGLSFLGLGVQIPEAEWGAMISAGSDDLVQHHWWPSVVPGGALFISVLAFNLLGEGLLDARTRGRPQ
jgi:peptide/nickel transport system permease protein